MAVYEGYTLGWTGTYTNTIIANGCNFTNYSAVGTQGLSEPCYIAFSSGGDQGLTTDACPQTTSHENLWHEMQVAGKSLVGYFEDMPSAGYTGCATGNYVRRHNPFIQFTNITDQSINMPFGGGASASGPGGSWPGWQSNLSDYSSLPLFTFVKASIINDGHSGSMATADAWVQTHFDSYIQWAKTHNSLFLLIADDNGGAGKTLCMWIGQGITPGSTSNQAGTHSNLCSTLAGMLGVAVPPGAPSAFTGFYSGPPPPVTRPVTLINDFGGGTAGQTCTPGNSGGASGASFDVGAVGATATFAYDGTQIPGPGQLAVQVATAGTTAFAYAGWNTSMTTPSASAALAQVWFRCYLYVPGTLAVNTAVFAALTSGQTVCGTVNLTAAGTVTFADAGGTARVTTAAFPLGQWFRVEGFIVGDPAAGQLSLALYASADSTTPSSAPAAATGLNTSGALARWRFGQAVAVANAGPYWLGNVGLSNAGYLGPTPLGFTSIRQDDGGAITNVTVSAPTAPAPPLTPGRPGPCGCTSAANVYPNATTRVAAAQAFDTIVSQGSATPVPMAQTAQKLYSGATATPPTSDLLNLALGPHRSTFYLCVKPPIPGTTPDVVALRNSLQAWLTAGVPASQLRVILYQEVQGQSVTAGQYDTCLGTYGPMIHGAAVGSPPVALTSPLKNMYDAAGHVPGQWLSYIPSASGNQQYIDEAGVDYYGDVFVNQYNANIVWDPATMPSSTNTNDPAGMLEVKANAMGVPFGFPELGNAIATSNAVGIDNANFAIYINYIQAKMVSRLQQGLANSLVAWYTSDQHSPVQNAIGGPHITVGAGSAGGSIKNIANSTWTSTTAGSLAPGNLVCSGNIASAGFDIGGRAGTVWVQCDDSTVARIVYAGIGGLGNNPAAGNTFTGCTYLDSWTGWTSPSHPGTGNTTVSAGALVAVWPFGSGETTDFRIPYMQGLYNALTAGGAPGGAVTLVAGGDVEAYFTSPDQGQHWQASSTGVYGVNWRRTACTQYATTGEGTNVIYSCTGLNGAGGGFLVSANGGQTWSMRSTQVQYSGNTTNITNDQARSAGTLLAQVVPGQLPSGVNDLMYTATYNGGVFRAKGTTGPPRVPNYGSNWVPIGLTGGTHFGRGITVNPANPASVWVSMFGEGVYHAGDCVNAATASFVLQATSPNQAEEIIALASGNVYVAGGSGAGGGLWTTPASGAGAGTWTQVGGPLTATGFLSSSSYWMSVTGYTDAAGNDQLVVGCNNPVQAPSSVGTGYRTLMWVTIPASGTPVFTDLTAVPANIQTAYIPPDTGRTWWHTDTAVPNPSQATGFKQWLGAPAYFQPHVTIDTSTVNTGNVTLYCAGAVGVHVSTGNTVGAAGPNASPQWTIAVNGMAAYVAHQATLDGGNPLHLGWATRDWGAAEVFDGCGYNAATTTQWTVPRSFGAGTLLGGFAIAIDPVTGIAFLSSGTKGGANTNGQIWVRDTNFVLANVSAATGTLPFGGYGGGSSTVTNAGGNVAYGLYAGRDGSNNPFLLALIQGDSGNGGMWRYSGYTISGTASRVSGGSWARVNAVIGTTGGAASEPTGPQGPIIADPNNAGIIYCFDQNSGLWRGSSYGAGAWTQLWAVVNNDIRSGFIACNPAVNGELWLSYWTSAAVPGGLFKIPNANTTGGPAAPMPSWDPNGNWVLTFSDEFDGTGGGNATPTQLDTQIRWNPNWGTINNVTTDPANISVSNSQVHLTLKNTSDGAAIFTRSYQLPVGGATEAMVFFPGSGSTIDNWPAFWWSQYQGNWPNCGEGDVAEGLGNLTTNYHGITSQNGPAPAGNWGGSWHTYGCVRGTTQMKVYWDGVLVWTHNTNDTGAGGNIILNAGVGQGPTVTGAGSVVSADWIRAWEPG